MIRSDLVPRLSVSLCISVCFLLLLCSNYFVNCMSVSKCCPQYATQIHCFARCFRAERAEVPRAVSAKLCFMQILCIAKRVTESHVSSNTEDVPGISGNFSA